jgi:major type 1 subunit fimbrin (pilin)
MNKISMLSAVIAMTVSGGAFAANGSIEFKGSINNDACTVTTAGSGNAIIEVPMGTVSIEDVGTAAAPIIVGSSSSDVGMDVTCKSAGKVTMTFAAPAANLQQGNTVLNLNTGSTAKGVGIAVYQTGSTAPLNLLNGKMIDGTEVASGETLRASFSAAYVAGTGAKTAGTANASLPFVLSYE